MFVHATITSRADMNKREILVMKIIIIIIIIMKRVILSSPKKKKKKKKQIDRGEKSHLVGLL